MTRHDERMHDDAQTPVRSGWWARFRRMAEGFEMAETDLLERRIEATEREIAWLRAQVESLTGRRAAGDDGR